MVAPIDLSSKNEVLRLRSILERVSDISFSYSHINKNYPLNRLDQEGVDKLIKLYHDLIRDSFPIIEAYKRDFAERDSQVSSNNNVQNNGTLGVGANV
jgi:hypothetical protein